MPPTRPRDLPEYASRAGDPCFPPPYVVDEAGMDIFICEGNADALGQMIDRALNIPTKEHYRDDHKLRFKLADHRVGFACIDVKRLVSKPRADQRLRQSVDPLPGVKRIYAHQTEVAVMVQVEDEAGMPYWYLPYVLNGLPTAVTTGREVYGYPKQHAVFQPKEDPSRRLTKGDRPLFGPERGWQAMTVRAYDLRPPVGHEAMFALTRVLEFRRSGRPAPTTTTAPLPHARPRPRPGDFELYAGHPWNGEGPAIAAVSSVGSAEQAVGGPVPRVDPASEDAAAAFLRRIRSDVPYVFLRQFREPERESFASYQALVIGRLIPDSADSLQIEASDQFSVDMPWAYNLALAKEVFGVQQAMTAAGKPPASHTVPVVGLLSGRNATFDVLRAAVVWQFGLDDRADDDALEEFRAWRREALAALNAIQACRDEVRAALEEFRAWLDEVPGRSGS
jgi:hypothetical protein